MVKDNSELEAIYIEISEEINSNYKKASNSKGDPAQYETFADYLDALRKQSNAGWAGVNDRIQPILDHSNVNQINNRTPGENTGAHISNIRTNKAPKYTMPYLVMLAHDAPAYAKKVFKEHKKKFFRPPDVPGFEGKNDWNARPPELFLISWLRNLLKPSPFLIIGGLMAMLFALQIALAAYVVISLKRLDVERASVPLDPNAETAPMALSDPPPRGLGYVAGFTEETACSLEYELDVESEITNSPLFDERLFVFRMTVNDALRARRTGSVTEQEAAIVFEKYLELTIPERRILLGTPGLLRDFALAIEDPQAEYAVRLELCRQARSANSNPR